MKKLLSKILANKAGIAMGLAVVGVGIVAVAATYDAKDYEEAKEEMPKDATKADKAVCFAKNHWRTGISIIGTVGLMALSHASMVKELAGATAAVAVAVGKKDEIENYFRKNYPEEYKKFKETVNKENIQKIFKEHPEYKKEETYDGRQRYYDPWSDQIFFATEAECLEAQKEVNKRLFNEGEATLHNFLSSFPKHCNVRLEHWMSKIGWYEGDTSYSYNAGYFGAYLEVEITKETILDDDGEEIEVNVINWICYPDFEPDLPPEEEDDICGVWKRSIKRSA